jgi:AraC-like DNA-binding protein/quercetin dioxygenase-like cupin family protein
MDNARVNAKSLSLLTTAETPRRDELIPPDSTRPVVAKRISYPAGFEVEAHWHVYAQFLFAVEGTMAVRTPRKAWTVPTSRALWIPPRTVHAIEMKGPVEVRTMFVAATATGTMPTDCVVLEVTPLLRELLVRATTLPDAPTLSQDDELLMKLLMVECQRLRHCALSLPLPQEPALLALCEQLLADLSSMQASKATAQTMNISARTLYRRFLQETGLSFTAWKQQARLLEAVHRLSHGVSVTTVALDLGYESPSAFSTMFKRALGLAPRDFIQRGTAGVTA